MTDELAYCNPKVTCVVEADLETVWKLFKQWGTFYWIKTVQGQPCVIKPYQGEEGQIGSVRSVQIGDSLMFERLVAMDDETHIIKWRTMAHEDSVSPFKEASYLNALLTVNVREITHGDQTFCEWQAEFYTEQEYAAEMHHGLEGWMVWAFEQLQEHLLTGQPEISIERRPSAHPQSPRSEPQLQQPQPRLSEEHIARFADLHVSSGRNPQHGATQHDPSRYARGMQVSYAPEPVQQTGKPMGSSSRQALPVGGSQPSMQSWHGTQAPPMRQSQRPPPGMTQEGAHAIQEWAARQQQAHPRQRPRAHGMGGPYTPSLVSERSGSFDGMEPPTVRSGQASRYAPNAARGMGQPHPDLQYSPHRQSIESLYDLPPDPRQYWEGPPMGQAPPMGASATMPYNNPHIYNPTARDPRDARSSSRGRPAGGSSHSQPRGSK